MANWYIPRTSQLYVAAESAYGTAASLAATDAVRHLSGGKMAFNPRNKTPSPERKTHPSQMALYSRRQSAEWAIRAMMYPSGALNTLPESKALLKAAFGAAPQNITLSTTFSGTPTTTGGTIGSATGLVVGQMVQITIAAGASAGVYMRRLTTASTSATWEPALPAAPASGDAFKGCITWTPATAAGDSLDIAHYPQAPASSTPSTELLGCVVEKMAITLDGTVEPVFMFSGPAQGRAGSSPNFSAQAQPGGFTTVGAEASVPAGMTGYFYLGSTLYEIERLQIDLSNALGLQNTALGTNKAKAHYRRGKRAVEVKIQAKVSDDTTLWTPTLANSTNAIFCQIGTTSGYIWGFYLPGLVILSDAEIPDGGDEEQNWDFQAVALGSSGNDELVIGMA